MREKSVLLQLKELQLGCSIEEHVGRRTEEGWTIPQIARDLKVSDPCLRAWIRGAGGQIQHRVKFPPRVPAEAAP